MNNQQVAHAWAHGHSGKGSNLRSDGIELISYSTTIAAIIDGVFYISSDSMSPTTGRHISYARNAVPGQWPNPNIFFTCAFSWSGSNPRLTHEAMILPAARDAISTLNYALENTKTRKQTKLNAIMAYIQERERIVNHAARFNVSVDMPDYSADVDTIASWQERKAAERAAAEAVRLKAQKKRQKEDKKQLNIWLTTGAGRCPASFIERGNDFITIAGHRTDGDGNTLKQGVILTSQGAECPLDHAIKALRLYINMPTWTRQDGTVYREPYHTNSPKIPLGMFALHSIAEDGTVKVGCHTFSAKTISAFLNQWREVLGL